MHALVPSFHRAYRWARPATRAAVSHFWQGLEFRKQTLDWPDDRKRDWMLERLRDTLRRADRETAFYRQWFAEAAFDPHANFTFEDFARLPILDRDDIRRAGARMISDAVPVEQLRKDATGGSSGVPTEIRTGPRERGWRESGMEHFMRRIGLPAGVRTALLWGHHLDPMQRDTLREKARDWLVNVRPFDCLRLSPDVLQRYHAEMDALRPACIVAYASALAALAEHLHERGITPRYPTMRVVTGAEKLLPHQRAIVERVFRCPVHERYGGRDVSLMGFQMDVPSRLDFETDWSALLIEPETAGGISPVIVTKLQADAMPMIRYRVGDVADFGAGGRPGHPSFRLLSVVGRETDRVHLPGGAWMDGLSFPHLMKDFPIREFQIHQRTDYSVTIRVVPASAFGDRAEHDILQIVRANLPQVRVELERVDEIPRTASNKRRPVISDVRSSASA
jgi:phenylacetate-CoA ligase